MSIFAIVIMLLSSLPTQSFNAARSSGLHLDSPLSSQGGVTNYPYLVNTSLYPNPDTLAVNDSYTLPQVTTTTASGVTTINVLAVNVTPSGNETLAIRSGTYSPTIAAQIAESNTSLNIPIQWGSWTYPFSVETGSSRLCYGEHCLEQTEYGAGYTTGITGTALANSAGGLVAAASFGGSTSVWGQGGPSGWTLFQGTPVSGSNPHLATLGGQAMLTTQTASAVEVTTFYFPEGDLYGYLTYHTTTLSVTPVETAAFWLPNEAGGEEGVVVSTPSGAIQFYDSIDGGFTFQGPYTIATFSSLPSNTTALNSIGSTELTNPYGWPGQVSATVIGATAMIIYTTDVGGVTAATTAVSVNPQATQWLSGYTTPPSIGSVAYPALDGSVMGSVYATWIQDNVETWSVELAVFSATGMPIQAPSALPGTLSASSPQTVSPPSLALDAFAQPFDIWAIDPGNGAPLTLRYTGAYLSASHALNVLKAQVNELQSGDFAAQSPGSLESNLSSDIASDLTTVGKITKTKTTYLCQAANLTANTIYNNVSHLEFEATTAVCGNFGYVEQQTTPPETDGVATGPPPNYYRLHSIAMSQGPMSAQSYLTTLTDWVLQALGVPVWWVGGSRNPETSNLPYTPVKAGIANATFDSKWFGETATPVPLSPTTVELQLSSSNPYPTYNTEWSSGGCNYAESTVPTAYYTNVTVNGAMKSFTSSTNLIQDVYLTNLTSDAAFNWTETLTELLEGYVTESCPHIYTH